MKMFYQGTLQDGISLAVSEAKAVICFVRGMLAVSLAYIGLSTNRCDWISEDTEACEQWENGYFGDDEV